MKLNLLPILIFCGLSAGGPAVPAHAEMSDRWTLDRCIAYAVAHSRDVRLQEYNLCDSRSQQQRAIGAFLPSVDASSGVQYNFGRAIDPKTNTYTDVGTFSNGYSLSASLSVFEGLRRYHALRVAKASVLLGRQGIQAQKDAVAMEVLRAYLDVQYYFGAVRLAREKRRESRELLRQAEMMIEVGTKGETDRLQMQSALAADEFEVERQEGLLEKASLALKRAMDYPVEDSLVLDTVVVFEEKLLMEAADVIYRQAETWNPSIQQAETSLRIARYQLKSAKASLFPSLSFGAGVSTSYYKDLGSRSVRTFEEQMKNNLGQYLSFTLSIPIFGRLNTITNIRDRRNDLQQARENLDNQRQELYRLIKEAVADQNSSCREVDKMEKKVAADSAAATVLVRKWEEGLASPLDVQTANVTLLQSRVQHLQCRLNWLFNVRILEYYQGKPLWTE